MLLRKKALLAIIPVIVLSACRSKEAVDAEIVDLPSHCYNDVKDEDEQGVDCGGSCNDCFQLSPTCDATVDSLFIDHEDGSTSNDSYELIDSIGVQVSNADEVLIALRSENGQRIKLRFPSSSFDITTRYTVVDYEVPVLESNHVGLEADMTFGEFVVGAYDNDYAYVNFDESTDMYSVTLCRLSYKDDTKLLGPYEVKVSFTIDFEI